VNRSGKGGEWYTAGMWTQAMENFSRADSQASVLSNLLSIFESEQGVLDRQYRLDRQSLRSVSAAE